jgi:hypothetical protein
MSQRRIELGTSRGKNGPLVFSIHDSRGGKSSISAVSPAGRGHDLASVINRHPRGRGTIAFGPIPMEAQNTDSTIRPVRPI